VKAVGVASGITGFGADLIIIDDAVKGRAVANSPVIREKTWDWYKDDIYTRLEPNAAVIVIQTRWHDDDLAGRLLKEMEQDGESWDVVRLPALSEPPASAGGQLVTQTTSRSTAETPASNSHTPIVSVPTNWPAAYAGGSDQLGRPEGEPLWPERFDRDRLMAIKRQLGAWSFAALYQQRPVPEGGTLFKREWFANVVSKAPEGLRWSRGYDLAVSLKDSADYTASFRVALDTRTGTIYIADGFRKRIEFPEQRKFVIERMEKEPDTAHGIELALHGQALLQDLRRTAATAGRVLVGVKVDTDKLMRAEAWSSYAEEGKIALVSGPWIADFVDEACRFTGRGDRHDDQVDAVSLAVQMIRRRTRGLHTF
jgi:predicted phage terminase large subunit-like protein